jgi:hypothetical protein
MKMRGGVTLSACFFPGRRKSGRAAPFPIMKTEKEVPG